MPDRLQRDRQIDGQKSSDRKTNKQAEKQLMRAIQTDWPIEWQTDRQTITWLQAASILALSSEVLDLRSPIEMDVNIQLTSLYTNAHHCTLCPPTVHYYILLYTTVQYSTLLLYNSLHYCTLMYTAPDTPVHFCTPGHTAIQTKYRLLNAYTL